MLVAELVSSDEGLRGASADVLSADLWREPIIKAVGPPFDYSIGAISR